MQRRVPIRVCQIDKGAVPASTVSQRRAKLLKHPTAHGKTWLTKACGKQVNFNHLPVNEELATVSALISARIKEC
jgi:hypothetical protein